ncbi:hypothetical protein K8R42_01350, partial [bacterium]|nr:hypothetical protein [bacterium]
IVLSLHYSETMPQMLAAINWFIPKAMMYGKNFTAVIQPIIITKHPQAKESIKSVSEMPKDIPIGAIHWNLQNREMRNYEKHTDHGKLYRS